MFVLEGSTMIHIRDEGEPIKQGFNFYPLNSYGSIGFVFRFRDTARWFRYSKITKRFSFMKANVKVEV